MSYTTIRRAMQDVELLDRVTTATLKEALSNPNVVDTKFAADVILNPRYGGDIMIGPVAVDTEASYESALLAGRGAPGHDVDIITDGQILSAVQAHWPQDPV